MILIALLVKLSLLINAILVKTFMRSWTINVKSEFNIAVNNLTIMGILYVQSVETDTFNHQIKNLVISGSKTAKPIMVLFAQYVKDLEDPPLIKALVYKITPAV